MIHSKDGTPMKAGPHPALAQGKVRYVGDHVAVVIAETLAQARTPPRRSPSITRSCRPWSTPRRRRAAQTQVHDVAPDNTVFSWHLGDKDATEAAFAQANT